MTKRELRREQILWKRLQRRYERIAFIDFYNDLREIMRSIPWENVSEENYERVIRGNMPQGAIGDALRRLYLKIGEMHLLETNRRIDERLGATKDAPLAVRIFRDLLSGYLTDEYEQNKIRTMEKTLADYTVRWLGRALGVEVSPNEFDPSRLGIQYAIDTIFESLEKGTYYKWQVTRIVRTETTAAANYAASVAGINAGLEMKKIWISGDDERVRRTPRDIFDHKAMHGEEVDQNEKFDVPSIFGWTEELPFPGHRSGSPENIINCRCTIGLIPKDLRPDERDFSPERLERIRNRRDTSRVLRQIDIQ